MEYVSMYNETTFDGDDLNVARATIGVLTNTNLTSNTATIATTNTTTANVGTANITTLNILNLTLNSLSVDTITEKTLNNGVSVENVNLKDGLISDSAYTTGVLHSDINGQITSSAIVNADIDNSASIQYSKLDLSNSVKAGDIDSETATNGYVLKSDGSGNASWQADTSGTGDVVGPVSSTDNAIVRFDTTTGKLIQNSGVIIDDSNNITGINDITCDTIDLNNINNIGGSTLVSTAYFDITGILSVDQINEYNTNVGVTVDGCLIKDGACALANNATNSTNADNVDLTTIGSDNYYILTGAPSASISTPSGNQPLYTLPLAFRNSNQSLLVSSIKEYAGPTFNCGHLQINETAKTLYAEGTIYTDTISEYTTNVGVTVDGCLIKDGACALANNATTATTATTATNANNVVLGTTTDTTCSVVLANNQNSTAQELKYDTGLTYNATTDTLTTTNLVVGTKTIITDGNPVGTILIWSTATAPTNYLWCDGSSYSTTTYSELFAVIAYTYGGSGGNFKVPEMRGRFPLGFGIGPEQTIPFYTYGGSATKTLAIAELPSHNHAKGTLATQFAYKSTTNTGAASNQTGSNVQMYNSSGITGSTANTGSGDSFSILNPYSSVNFCIKYQ